MVRAALTLPLIPARARGACRRSPSIRYKPVCDNRLDCCWHHELIKKQKMVGTETEVIEYCEDCRSATSPPPPSPPPPPSLPPPSAPVTLLEALQSAPEGLGPAATRRLNSVGASL